MSKNEESMCCYSLSPRFPLLMDLTMAIETSSGIESKLRGVLTLNFESIVRKGVNVRKGKGGGHGPWLL